MIRTLLILLLPILGGLACVEAVGQSWQDPVKIRVWLALAIAPIVIRQILKVFRSVALPRPASADATGSGFERVLHKSLALALSWTVVLAWAYACSLLDVGPAIILLDDVLPLLPFLLIALPLGVLLLERLEGPASDQWSRLGAALCGRATFRLHDHKNALLTTALKAVFIPIMYGNVIIAMGAVLQLGAMPTFTTWVLWLYAVGLSVDLVVGTIGYVFASRVLGTGVRSVDDTILGWLVCLVCYAPFFQYVRHLTAQADSYVWSDWLSPSQPLYWIWAALVVSTWVVYWLSHTAFGLRFSNLSYRGLVDAGPYRFLKHPAYLAKNLYWWLSTVPFYGVLNAGEMARNVAGLSLLSFIYYMRAKTEERHLSRFPEYVEYSRVIDARWSGIRRLFVLPLRTFKRAA